MGAVFGGRPSSPVPLQTEEVKVALETASQNVYSNSMEQTITSDNTNKVAKDDDARVSVELLDAWL